MPRKARIIIKNGIYHIICKSNSDSLLFREDEDKEKYSCTLKKYCDQYGTRVHGICFMDNHVHFLLELCGADLGSFMKSINVSYVSFYNRKYGRKGSLMGERYKSIPIEDSRNLIQASLYIHRNPKDLPIWKNDVEKYPYSSLGVFLGLRSDELNLIEVQYIMKYLGDNLKESRKRYVKLFQRHECIKSAVEYNPEVNIQYDYRSEKIIRYKSVKPEVIVKVVSDKLNIHQKFLNIKNSSKSIILRNVVVFFLRKYAGMSQKDICRYIGNITQSAISRMCSAAVDIVNSFDFEKVFDKLDELCNDEVKMV